MKSLIHLAIVLLLLVPNAFAADSPDPTWYRQAEKNLASMQAEIAKWKDLDATQAPSIQTFDQRIAELIALRRQAEDCTNSASNDLNSINAKLEAVGPQVDDESAEIRKRRAQLNDSQRDTLQRLAVCRLLDLGAKDAMDVATRYRQDALSQALLAREAPLWGALRALLTGDTTPAPRKLDWTPSPAAISLALSLALLLPPAIYVARRLRRFADGHPNGISTQRLLRMYASRLPFIAVVLALAMALFAGGGAPLAAPLLFLAAAATLGPLMEQLVCQQELRCREGLPARLLLALVLLATAALLGNAQSYVSPNVALTLRGIFLVLLALSALWLLWRVSQHPDMGSLRGLRLPLALLLVSGPVADWIGYRSLGELLTLGIYGTLTGAFLGWLAYHAVDGALSRFEGGEGAPAQALRRVLGYPENEPVAGLRLLRRVIALGLLIAYGYWLLAVWRVSDADTATARGILSSGFELGGLHIMPSRLFQAVMIFLLLWWLARWLRRQMGERWLVKTKLDSGARQSIVMLTSYTLIGAAILLGLSVAGLEFQNLAIIAGALSVGIGFGLQNIVNNFVSGLILLFERPVKPGDWVVVGNTEGYVRKVSIRSTLIQTFDRADVLVPNSELISNQVTNWMLNDTLGRVIVPVGVAYGTDTRKVRDLLNKVAREHPLVVISDPRVAAPKVLFMGFGESSLDFELRCFIRDVDYRLSVRSDLLFAIDDAFREAGIEIPFPQRVVHLPAHDALDGDPPVVAP